MKKLLLLLLCLSALSCETKSPTFRTGFWRATLDVQDDKQLPFIFEVKDNETLVIQNAEERITVDEIEINGKEIRIQTPVFEGYFQGTFSDDGKQITGDFIKPSLDRVVPFQMIYGDGVRFSANRVGGRESASPAGRSGKKPTTTITGNWETVFSENGPEDTYIAKGIFRQDGRNVTGTFRTTTGDYRFLEGVIDGDQLQLSTFDGAHAFLFTATATDSTLQGYFYSGNHWKEPFRAKRNENYELPDAKDLTYIKEGYDGLAFTFPDADGTMVSLDDERYKNKVVLVQILGSWCPNCLEESKFYVDYIKQNPNPDFEIIGLAFEYAPTQEKAFTSIQRLKNRLGISYPILLAQHGSEDKKLAQEKLPMLNHIISYPTSIFIDKKGKVRRIHTGFNGAATGQKFLDFKTDFDQYVKKLLAE
ncbi:TlpA disulfide reductase family protein [uncultured Dokdonia sp.]|uniref:peroxiredoxin family protein n=1 Tax=uncultured Dokdonia sp. TaxID=575653 RepID=UPI00262D36D5|nr:TlpA disulfide reductase family protein [uncultured Dokdonia sp.]